MNGLLEKVRRFHEDESGAPEMSTVMIVALIAIPLVIALILFGKKIYQWFTGAQSNISGQTSGGNGDPGVSGGGWLRALMSLLSGWGDGWSP